MRVCAVGLCLILWGGSAALADSRVDYARDIKPLLAKRCVACHGVLKQQSDLRLDTGAFVRTGGSSGPAVVPGNPAGSLLIERVLSTDAALRMPPEGAPLTPEEIGKIQSWVEAGAISPENEKPQADPRDHWAFRAPVRAPVPAPQSVGVRNPVDAFIFARLAAADLEPLPEADKVTLLRRVTLDLTGLPPTPEELQAFLADTSDGAYETVVDRLLQSPRYGERWGRHWMDVWRYSDWYGRRAVPDVMNSYPQIWRWRDWIVTSLNQDKGYDRMVVEMLAADEWQPGDDESVVATGFLVRNWFKWNYENWMKDNVEHTAKAFLGLTLNCAHCHDHKYDPISQAEYFRFRACFEPLELRQDRVAGLPDPGPFQKYVYAQSYGPIAAGRIRVFDEKLTAETFMYAKGDSRNRLEGKPPVEPGVLAILGAAGFEVAPIDLPAEAYYPGLKSTLRDEEMTQARAALAAAQEALTKSQAALAAAQQQRDDIQARAAQPATAADRPTPADVVRAEQLLLDARLASGVDQQLVVQATARRRALSARLAADDARYRGLGDVEAQSQAAWQAEKQALWEEARLRLVRAEQGLIAAERQVIANPTTKPAVDKAQAELVAARTAADAARAALATAGTTYTPLSPVYPQRSTGRRLALARWIAHAENPLTARVAVNHMWLRHFGRGLVETPANFGRNGKLPSHPELLDWLAVELVSNGWKMKPLHRLLVTSRTYRLRSGVGPMGHRGLEQDPDNRLYWRSNTRRMEAEVVRDSLLACAGELDPTIGGQELDAGLGLTSRRRSLYFAIHGEAKMPFLELFDAADVCDCYERVSSVRPQQALALVNSDLSILHSRLLAKKLWAQIESTGSSDGPADSSQKNVAFVRQAFLQILSRPVREDELRVSLEFLNEQLQELAAVNPAERPGEAGGIPAPASDPAQRARESLISALFNHNDFVTIR
ncbi:MAG: PSD1 domain-containing protein [Planctomycetes bacterium]|nr:PSD1 domain-containing protein [Planctomycetota bacterium]